MIDAIVDVGNGSQSRSEVKDELQEALSSAKKSTLKSMHARKLMHVPLRPLTAKVSPVLAFFIYRR